MKLTLTLNEDQAKDAFDLISNIGSGAAVWADEEEQDVRYEDASGNVIHLIKRSLHYNGTREALLAGKYSRISELLYDLDILDADGHVTQLGRDIPVDSYISGRHSVRYWYILDDAHASVIGVKLFCRDLGMSYEEVLGSDGRLLWFNDKVMLQNMTTWQIFNIEWTDKAINTAIKLGLDMLIV